MSFRRSRLVLILFPALLQAQESGAPLLKLSMRDAIRMALSPHGSTDLDIVAEAQRAAEARSRESHDALLPDMDATVGAQNQVINLAALGFESVHLPIPGFSFPRSIGPFDTVDARVHVRQSAFDLASIRRSRATHAAVETAKDETGEVRGRVAAEVAKLYLASVRAASLVETAEVLVGQAGAALREISNRNASGKALDVEVDRARLQLASDDQNLLSARMEQNRANLELLDALNRDLDLRLDLTDRLAFIPQDALEPARALAIALQSRPDIVAQRQRVKVARLNDDSIRAERLPTLAGFADLGTLGTGISDSVGTYDAGVSLRIPVFDSGRRNARLEETQAMLRQEELRAAQLERRVRLEVRQALLRLETARGQVNVSAQEVAVAEQEVAHRSRLQEQGVGGQMDLVNAQVALARANAARTDALYFWNLARIELMQALGTIETLAQ